MTHHRNLRPFVLRHWGIPWALVIGTSVLVALSGCGPDRPDTITVSGKVTFAGGAPPAEGMIYFACVEPAEGYDRRPGSAPFGTDGSYEVKSFEEGDGLVPGKYEVGVECWDSPPMMGKPVKSYVPKRYQASKTSGLEVVIESGAGIQEVTFDVPKQ